MLIRRKTNRLKNFNQFETNKQNYLTDPFIQGRPAEAFIPWGNEAEIFIIAILERNNFWEILGGSKCL